MKKDFVSKLKCSECGTDLSVKSISEETQEIVEGFLICESGHEWRIHEGVLDFNSQEQDFGNNWTEMYKSFGYLELDEYIMSRVPEVQQQSYKAAILEIISSIENSESKSVLDIATGRGMLLVELIRHFGSSVEFVCVDLSHKVLKFDRLKCLELNEDANVNFIACDATNIPLKSEIIDLAVSFCGIQNIEEFASAGVHEGHRVSKHGLLNFGIIIKDDNPQIDALNEALKTAGSTLTLNSATESGFEKIHESEKFTYDMNTIFEGIGEPQEGDMIPIENEWFALTYGKTLK
jgi:ubiquinone/menaquinone biosynthesis C-methylase UbiE